MNTTFVLKVLRSASTALTVSGVILAAATANAALPVIPGASGFGITTRAGRGGTVHKVTTLRETGAGTLRACVDASGPRVCIFEVSGTIQISGDLIVRNRYLTIAGQTAPSPGIMLRGGGLLIKTSDVLVQHIRVRPGDDPGSTVTAADNRDALKIEGPVESPIHNVVIDHCSFSWSVDEVASAWQAWDNVTLSNNIFAEPLNDSIHSKGAHGYGLMIGPVDGQIAVIGNLFSDIVERNPLSNATHLLMVNNVISNWANMAVDLQSRRAVTHNSLVGNVFIRGADYTRQNSPISLRTDSTALPAGSKVYLEDNQALESSSDSWSVAGALGGALSLVGFKAATPPVWISGLTARSTGHNSVKNYVLKFAGARPLDRDTVDMRIVQGARNGTGRIINCVASDGSSRCQKNAGGWPVLAERTRSLTLPSNPHSLAASGYTNLEVWLQAMSRDVEGNPDDNAPIAPGPLLVR